MVEKVEKPYKKTKPIKQKRTKDKGRTNSELDQEITAVLEEIKNEEPVKEKKKGETVTVTDDCHLLIGERQYTIVKNHREAFDPERLGERFSDVLSKYDYIVGDWGYDQLRLKGFFNPANRKVHPEQHIDTLEDYLYEYCNFGCAYFVLERLGRNPEKQTNKRKRAAKKIDERPVKKAVNKEKRAAVQTKNQPVIKDRKEQKSADTSTNELQKIQESGRSFTIRQRKES